MKKIISKIKNENFLYGGLIYHHKEIENKEERRKIFNNIVDTKLGKGTTTIENASNLYRLKEQLEFIKNSQSLTSTVLDKTFEILNSKSTEHPLERVYEDDNNIFAKDGVLIIPSDILIFISIKGIMGDLYEQNISNQELCILYDYIPELDIYTGEVYDYKLVRNYKEYSNIMEEI